MKPVTEIYPILNERESSWGYVAAARCRMIAASDGDAILSTHTVALAACVAEVKAGFPSGKGGDDDR